MWPKLYAADTKINKFVPQISVYSIVAQNASVDTWIHWLTLGYLILMDNYKREIQTRFCCRGHLLPTVKTNVYLYTDIDIFKTRHQLFFFLYFYFFFFFVLKKE